MVFDTVSSCRLSVGLVPYVYAVMSWQLIHGSVMKGYRCRRSVVYTYMCVCVCIYIYIYICMYVSVLMDDELRYVH